MLLWNIYGTKIEKIKQNTGTENSCRFVHHKYHTDFHETGGNTNNTYIESLIFQGLVFKLEILNRLQPLPNLGFVRCTKKGEQEIWN